MTLEPKGGTCLACWSALDDAVNALDIQSQALAALERLLADSGAKEAAQLACLLSLIRAKGQTAHAALTALAFEKSG